MLTLLTKSCSDFSGRSLAENLYLKLKLIRQNLIEEAFYRNSKISQAIFIHRISEIEVYEFETEDMES